MKKNVSTKMQKFNVKRFIIFFIIATLVSNVFRFDVFGLNKEIEKIPKIIYISMRVLLEGSGVLIAALIALHQLKKERSVSITLLGTSKIKNIFMITIPLVLITIAGVKNEYGINSHLYALTIYCVTLLYCIFEEYGWRGYLLEEFKNIVPSQKYILIGVLWYIWHLSFLQDTSLQSNLFFLVAMILGSWGIGQVVDSTKSILSGACFHLIIQMIFFNKLFKNAFEGYTKWIFVGICVISFFVIVKKWEKEYPKET